MAVLTLKILGGFEARRSSGEVAEIPIRKGQALLAFLVLNPGEAVARSKLAGLFWGDCDDAQARTNLRQTLTVLRRALEPVQDQVLRADRLSISLDGRGVEVDAVSFQNLIARGTPADLEAAVSLYRGELLDGIDLPDPGFQAWLENQRRRFHDLMAGALNALMAHKRGDGAPEEAISLAQRLLILDPLREDVHCALMLLYAELGQRHAVQQQYQRCRELLASELNVEPAAETEALYRTLRDNDTAGAGSAKVSGAIVVRGQETDDRAKMSLDNCSDDLPAPVTGASPRSLRRAAAVGRAAMIGGFAALSWLLAWGHPVMPPPPDLLAFLQTGVLSSDNLSRMLDGVSESSGPALLHRMALQQPDEPSAAGPSFDTLSGVLERVTESSAPIVPAEVGPSDEERSEAEDARHAMQREADGLWPELAESWNLHAVRAFKTRYPATRQITEADLRIAFLIARHREAQTDLDRLGYDVGPVDGVWGRKSIRAMRAFQSDSGLAPDGMVSAALLDRLKTATPKTTAPTPAPDARPQLVHLEPEVAVASPSVEDGIPEGSRWTASGTSPYGSRIMATATRRGADLELVFELDHRESLLLRIAIARYTDSCTVSASKSEIECWIASRTSGTPGARISGTFPKLTFRTVLSGNFASYIPEESIVLDFCPELRLARR